MYRYVVHVSEEHEVYAKNHINSNFPGIKAIIPIASQIDEVDNKRVLVFTRPLEEYLILSCDQPLGARLKQIQRVNGVLAVLSDGSDEDSVPDKEIGDFLAIPDKERLASLKDGYVNVINGTHAGRRGHVVSYKNPILKVNIVNSLNDKKALTILIPIWDVVKILEGDPQ